MDPIAITKPNMGTLPQNRPGLSPFGVLSQAFSQELLARAGSQEGHWPFVALDLLEEGEEAPAGPPPVQPVAQVDLTLVLQSIRQLDMRTEKAVERVVERIVHLREQGRPHPAPVQPAARGGGRKGSAGPADQTAGPESADEGRTQSRGRSGSRQAVPEREPGGGKNAAQTPEPVLSAAGSFVRLQNFYNTIDQHLQFITNIRESGIWRPDSPASLRGTSKGLNGRSIELFRRAYGLRRGQGRLPVPAAVPGGIPSLAGAAVPLTAGNTSGLPRYDAFQRGTGPLTAGGLAYLEDGMGGAVMDGAVDTAAGNRRMRRETGQLERAAATQAIHPDVWGSTPSVRIFHPVAWESMRSVRMLHPEAWESMRSAGTFRPEVWGSVRSVRTLHPDTWQSVPAAWMLRRGDWNSMPGLDLWKQSAGEKMFGQKKAAGWPPQSIPQRPWAVEGPMQESRKTALAPHRGISAIETAIPAGQAHWDKGIWNISRPSAVPVQMGTEGQAAPVLPPEAPGPVPLMGGELAHKTGREEKGLPGQTASTAEPVKRDAFEHHTVSAAVRSALLLHGGTVSGPGGLTAREAGPMGADAAARSDKPAADPSRMLAMSFEESGQGSSTMGIWPRTEKQESPILPPYSEMPGGELAHRSGPIGPEWDLGSTSSTGRAQTIADRARASADSADRAQTLADRMWTSTDKARASADRTRTSANRARISVGGAQISPDTPVRPLETASAVKHGQVPQASPAAVQSRPPVSALRDIRTVKAERNAAEPDGAQPDKSQTGRSLSALFEAEAGLIHSAGLDRDSVPAPAEAGARTPAVLAAQAKGQSPQADPPQGKTRQAKPAVQTGRRGAQSGAPQGQARTGTAAGSIEQAGGTAAMRYVPLAVDRTQDPLTVSPQDIRRFAAGRTALSAGVRSPRENRSAAPYREDLPPEEMTYGTESKDTTGTGVGAPREVRAAAPYQEILPPGEMIYGVQSQDTAGADTEKSQESRSAAPHQDILPPGKLIYSVQGKDTAGTDVETRQEDRSAALYQEILPPEEMVYGVQSKDTAGAGVEAPQEDRSATPYQGILPPGEMVYGGQSQDTAGASIKARQEDRSATPYQGILPPGEMVYGAQSQDTAGAGKDAQSRAAPPPLELTYGGTSQPSTAGAPASAAKGQKPVHDPMGSDYVRDLPDWARRFLQEGAPQTREEAVRRLGTGREQTMGTAQSIAVLPSFSEEAGSAFQWTAPDTRVPAPVEYREPRRQQDPPQPRSARISDAELQRTADRVYRIIEDRIRRERWRLGL